MYIYLNDFEFSLKTTKYVQNMCKIYAKCTKRQKSHIFFMLHFGVKKKIDLKITQYSM